MKFYEKVIEVKHEGVAYAESYEYTVNDVFGCIVINSDKKLDGATLDSITMGIMQSGFSTGQIRPGLSFDWDKKSDWVEDEKPTTFQEEITTLGISPDSRGLALILCFCLGSLGLHRFYIGRYKTGIMMLLFSLSLVGIVFSFILSIVDFFMILTGTMHDSDGKRIARW